MGDDEQDESLQEEQELIEDRLSEIEDSPAETAPTEQGPSGSTGESNPIGGEYDADATPTRATEEDKDGSESGDTEEEEEGEGDKTDADLVNESASSSDTDDVQPAESDDGVDENDTDDEGEGEGEGGESPTGPLDLSGSGSSEKREQLKRGDVSGKEIREEFGISKDRGETAEATGESGSRSGPQGTDAPDPDQTDTEQSPGEADDENGDGFDPYSVDIGVTDFSPEDFEDESDDGPEPEPESEPEPEPEPEPETESEPQSEPSPEPQSESDQGGDTESGPEVDSDPSTKPKSEIEAEAKEVAGLESEPEPEVKDDSGEDDVDAIEEAEAGDTESFEPVEIDQTDTPAEPTPPDEGDSEPDVDEWGVAETSEADADNETSAIPESEPEPEPEPQSEPDPEPSPDPSPEPEPESESGLEPELDESYDTVPDRARSVSVDEASKPVEEESQTADEAREVALSQPEGLLGTVDALFGGIADALFLWLIAGREGLISRYQWNLNQARISMSAERFLTRAIAVTVLATLAGGAIGAAVGVGAGEVLGPIPALSSLPADVGLPVLLGVGSGVLYGAVSGYLIFSYPSRRVRVREQLISHHLPLSVAHLYALSKTNIEVPETIRQVSANNMIHGEAGHEFQRIVKEVDLRGTPLRDAIAKGSSETPNEELSDLLGEMVEVLNGMGSLTQLLEARLSQLREQAEVAQEQVLSEVTDKLITYTVVGVLGVALATVLLAASGQSLTIAAGIFYVLLPTLGILSLFQIDSQQTLSDLELASRLPTPDRPSREETGGERGMVFGSRIPRVSEHQTVSAAGALIEDGTELTEQVNTLPQASIFRRAGSRLSSLPFENQAWALPLSGILAGIYLSALLALGIGDPTAPLATINSTTIWAVVPLALVLIPPAAYYEVVRIHNEQVNEALPIVFRALATAGQRDLDFTARVGRAVENSNSYISDELNRLHNNLTSWTGMTDEALITLANRVQNPRLSRAVITLVDAVWRRGGELRSRSSRA